MEHKNISSNFTLQTQTKYKNIKIQSCLRVLLQWDVSFQSSVKRHISPKCLCVEIQTLKHNSETSLYRNYKGGKKESVSSSW